MTDHDKKTLKNHHIAKCGLILSLGNICLDQKIRNAKAINWNRVSKFARDVVNECKERITTTGLILSNSPNKNTPEFQLWKNGYQNHQTELALNLTKELYERQN